MKSESNKAQFARKAAGKSGQKGFTLLELLVAMVIFLIVTGSIYGLLQVGRIDRNRSSRRSDVLKNARVAVHLIGRDAFNAGLSYNSVGALAPENFVSATFGLPVDPDTRRDAITSIMIGNNLHPNDLNPDPAIQTDSVVFSYRDMEFHSDPAIPGSPGKLVQLADVGPGGSATTARVRATAPVGSPVGTRTGVEQAQVNHLYLVESGTTQVAVMATAVNGVNTVDAATGDPLALNQPLGVLDETGSVLRQCLPPDPGPPIVPDGNCTTYVATLKHFNIVEYRVKQDGTLVRRIYGNNVGGLIPGDQIREQPLAYGVEDMQITYVLKDGTVTSAPTAFSLGADNAPGGGNDVPDQLNLIRQVTVTIRVQATGSDSPTQRPESITFSATFAARNMEYIAGS